jgi:hypothetical protein
MEGSYIHSNEPSDSIKRGESLDYLRDYYLLKKNSVHGVSVTPVGYYMCHLLQP